MNPAMNLKPLVGALVIAGACLPFVANASCVEKSPWTARAGVHDISPSAGASSTAAGDVSVKSKVTPTLNLDYRFCKYFEVDVLGSLPVTHDIALNGAEVGTTRELPPTVSLRYHPLTDSKIDPYAGLGINRTFFFNESLSGGANLQLSNTWGYAAQIGADWLVQGPWIVGADVRYVCRSSPRPASTVPRSEPSRSIRWCSAQRWVIASELQPG